MVKKIIKDFLKKHINIINYFPFNNSFKLDGASLKLGNHILINCRFNIYGHNNKIELIGGGGVKKLYF